MAPNDTRTTGKPGSATAPAPSGGIQRLTEGAPHVWTGCLGCYAAGDLHGYWVDAINAPESTEDWLTACRAKGQAVADPGIYDLHEELWCFDHEGFMGFIDGEFSPVTAREVAEMIEGLESDGLPVVAVAGWASHEGEKLREAEREGQSHSHGEDPQLRRKAGA